MLQHHILTNGSIIFGLYYYYMDPMATYYIFDKWQRNILLKAKTYLIAE